MGKNSAEERKPGPNPNGTKYDAEAILAEELRRANMSLRGVPPVLAHMLASSGHALVTDAIVARIRGMVGALAGSLAAARSDGADYSDREIEALTDSLATNDAILSYCYSLAIEAHLIERLESSSSIDSILSPLLQELVASSDATTGELAMKTLAAQSRFIQNQRRMDLPLAELPAELFVALLKHWQAFDPTDQATQAARTLKGEYDESAGRVGLLTRLVASMRGGAIAALHIGHAGLPLFVTALAKLAKQPRELCVLACQNGQTARLALTLRAAGLEADEIERQFLVLHPAERLHREFLVMPRARAASLLAGGISADRT